MTCDIRKLDRHPLAQINGLMSALGYSLGEDELDDNIHQVRLRGGEVFVATWDGAIAGCVCAIIDARLAAGCHGEIVSLVVLEAYRGRDIGRDLVGHAEKWLAKRTSRIRVRANAVRTEAHGFYRSMGYAEIKTQKIFVKHLSCDD